MSRRPAYRPATLRQIEAFKAVIEMGTVSRAAEALNMSQPAASKLLANLEADTGLELFERRRGLLVPNARGLRFYEEVDRIFSGMGQINRAIEKLRHEETGRLVVGTLPGLSGEFIAQVVGRFLQSYPDVHIEIHARSSRYLLDRIRSGSLDLAVAAGDTENDPNLISKYILTTPLVVALPKGHRLAGKTSLSIEDLADERIIAFTQNSYTRRQLDRMFQIRGLLPNLVMQTTNAPTLGEMVACGFGVTLAHPLLLEPVRGRVVVRPLDAPETSRLLVSRPRHGRNGALAEAFLDCLEAAAGELLAVPLSG